MQRNNASASDWRAVDRGALKGTFTLTLPSGMILRECALFEKEGRRWVAPPQKQIKIGDTTKYISLIEFVDRETRDRFSEAALAAIDSLPESARFDRK